MSLLGTPLRYTTEKNSRQSLAYYESLPQNLKGSTQFAGKAKLDAETESLCSPLQQKRID